MNRLPRGLEKLDSQAEDAWLDLRCQRAREAFVESMMQESGKSKGEVEAIIDETMNSTLRILPADEPAKKEEREFFGVVYCALATIGAMAIFYWGARAIQLLVRWAR